LAVLLLSFQANILNSEDVKKSSGFELVTFKYAQTLVIWSRT